MSDFNSEQQRNLEGVQFNAQKVSPEFRKVRFLLDNAATKDDIELNAKNKFLGNFKSFWISDTNNNSFTASIVVNPKNDVGQALPLKVNMSLSFDYQVAGCAFEWAAQPGTWIDVIFSLNTAISVGYIALNSSGSTVLSEGSSFTDGPKLINNTGNSVLIPTNSGRKVAYVQNNSAQPIWIGSASKLSGVTYKVDCQRIDSGDAQFAWRSSGQLNARVETTTTSIAVMELS